MDRRHAELVGRTERLTHQHQVLRAGATSAQRRRFRLALEENVRQLRDHRQDLKKEHEVIDRRHRDAERRHQQLVRMHEAEQRGSSSAKDQPGSPRRRRHKE